MISFCNQQKVVSDRQTKFSIKIVVNLFLSFILLSFILLLSLTACSASPRVNASERLFLNLSLEFLDRYELPKTIFKDTPVGGLSAIAYNRQQDLFYALSDDRSQRAPARFYTLDLDFKQLDFKQKDRNSGIAFDNVEIENVTFLRDETGNTYQPGTIDSEGMSISPRGTIFISSEGDPKKGVKPFIGEFNLETGIKQLDVPIPQRYIPDDTTKEAKGIEENLAFEALTLNHSGLLSDDPFRLFTATESSLIQDKIPEAEAKARIRFLHYAINPFGKPVLVAEHLYLLEAAPIEVISNGLCELLALKTEGYFLSLERTFGFTGAGAKIFQVVIGDATDTSNIDSLKGELTQIQTLKKQQLFDLQELGIYLDNIEGMTLGPRLPDGSQSLLLISDDNFNDEQVTQLLLFRLNNY